MLGDFDGLLLAKGYQIDAWREAANDRLAGDVAAIQPRRTLTEWARGCFIHTWVAPGARPSSAALHPHRIGGGS